jgi:hypothetical protein
MDDQLSGRLRSELVRVEHRVIVRWQLVADPVERPELVARRWALATASTAGTMYAAATPELKLADPSPSTKRTATSGV